MHKNGCLICGEELVYSNYEQEAECVFCHQKFKTHAICPHGHYVCDTCHAQKGIEVIKETCLQMESRSPIQIIQKIMDSPYIYMHGPEHHVMVAASLLTAYFHAGGDIDLSATIDEAIGRGKEVPGGVCGYWGCCGAAISAGIFLSIILHTSPLSHENWGLSNQLTGQCLQRIGEVGGPRCCKRDSFIAIETTIHFVEEHFHIKMQKEKISCHYRQNNRQCLGTRCPFFQK